MAREVTDQTNNAAESLVKATVIVLDRVNVQGLPRSSIWETSKMLGGNSIVMLS